MTREQELETALRTVLTWIDNWDPAFIYDDEWPETRDLVERALKTEETP